MPSAHVSVIFGAICKILLRHTATAASAAAVIHLLRRDRWPLKHNEQLWRAPPPSRTGLISTSMIYNQRDSIT